MAEHIVHVIYVLRIIAEHGLKLTLSKFHFAQLRMELIGRVVVSNRICVYMKHIQAIREAPLPTTKMELRSFLRLVGYCRRFIKGIAERASFLHGATSDKKKPKLSDDKKQAFE